MRTWVYVDGFNLYYRAVRGTPHKWLDLAALCRTTLGVQNQILGIKYFTADVHPRPTDPDIAVRQQIYLRALRTLPCLEIIKGTFLSHVVSRPQTTALAGRVVPSVSPPHVGWVNVVEEEEKGSDVNLAVHMVHDAHRGRFDVAVLVSNDSDLAEAVRLLRVDLKLKVGLLCPSAPRHGACSAGLRLCAALSPITLRPANLRRR